jgi:3-oxoacid CoA-transferase B subunit
MALLWVVVGCASNADPTAGWTVEKLHEEAKSEMEAGAFEKAIGLFDKLEGRAAGTVLSQQAQLEKAFAQYKNNEPILAVATLDRFIRLNPVNPALDYALYLKGTINFNDDLGLLGGILKPDLSERDQMAARAAHELRDGYYVNLGIGIPTLVANHVAPDIDITLQSENGILGLGAFPTEAEVDPDIINAGKQTVTELDRTSYVSSADSFGMIRGGHIQLSVLGAMEVAENGDLANWMVPGKMVKGPGGAMDLVAGVRRIIVLMDHLDKAGSPKFRRACTLPLTGTNVVDMVITNLAVFERPDRASPFRLIERAPGVTLDQVRDATEARFEVSPA